MRRGRPPKRKRTEGSEPEPPQGDGTRATTTLAAPPVANSTGLPSDDQEAFKQFLQFRQFLSLQSELNNSTITDVRQVQELQQPSTSASPPATQQVPPIQQAQPSTLFTRHQQPVSTELPTSTAVVTSAHLGEARVTAEHIQLPGLHLLY